MAPGELTLLIRRWQRGDASAENALFEAIYQELLKIARHCLRTERPGQTLGATALVHEAYLRFERAESLQIADRNHFLALAARVMRRILVDRARARLAEKRGGDQVRVDQLDLLVRTDADADEILAVNSALEELRKRSPRQSQLVELHWFAGYSLDESAAILGVSKKTLQRDWQVARVRLHGAIDGTVAAT